MRALGELVILVAVVMLIAWLVSTTLQRRGEEDRRWRCDTRTRSDGTLLVVLRRGGGDERVVRELPPGMDPVDLAAELQLAREEADLALRELNRP